MQYNLKVNGAKQLLEIFNVAVTTLSYISSQEIFIIDDNSTTTLEHWVVVL